MFEYIFIILMLIFAIVFHEYAHGWVAYKCGDPTAKLAGRLTLNPIKHIDPVGTLLIPGIIIIMRFMGVSMFLFGWARPVPVNFMRLRNPKRDMIWVGMAGPAINIVIAMFLSYIIKIFGNSLPLLWRDVIVSGVFINILLATFNMIPVPPLDGSRLVMGLLPDKLVVPYSRLEPYGIIIVVLLISLGVFGKVILPAVMYIMFLLGL